LKNHQRISKEIVNGRRNVNGKVTSDTEETTCVVDICQKILTNKKNRMAKPQRHM